MNIVNVQVPVTVEFQWEATLKTKPLLLGKSWESSKKRRVWWGGSPLWCPVAIWYPASSGHLVIRQGTRSTAINFGSLLTCPRCFAQILGKVLGNDLFLDLLKVVGKNDQNNGVIYHGRICKKSPTKQTKLQLSSFFFFRPWNPHPSPTGVCSAMLPFISLLGGKSDSVALVVGAPVSKVLPWGRILEKTWRKEMWLDLFFNFNILQCFSSNKKRKTTIHHFRKRLTKKR